ALETIKLGEFLREAQIALGCQEPLHQRTGGRKQHRVSLFDQRMAESTDEVALPGTGSPNGDDVDRLGQEAAVAQALDLHPSGCSEAVEVERSEVLAGQQTRIAPQAIDPSCRLGRPFGAGQFEQERL